MVGDKFYTRIERLSTAEDAELTINAEIAEIAEYSTRPACGAGPDDGPRGSGPSPPLRGVASNLSVLRAFSVGSELIRTSPFRREKFSASSL